MVARFAFLAVAVLALNCLNNDGEAVDWYVALKMSQYAYGPYGGKTFAVSPTQYFDDDHMTNEIQDRALNDTTFMTYTLNQFNEDNVNYVFYNDEAPGEATYNFTFGHSKGILAYTSSEAIFLVHSIPGFPVLSNGKVVLDIPNTGIMYGQSFMCVQLDPSQVYALAGMMRINFPNVYASQVYSNNANVSSLVEQNWENGNTLSMSLGYGFTYLCKSAAANIELWEDLVCPYYGLSFNVQSWGKPYMDSYCTPNYTYNAVNVAEEQVGSTWWYGSDDHSKWGVSKTGSITCVGDINRMTSQAQRGGGVLCFEDEELHELFSDIVTETQPCGTSG